MPGMEDKLGQETAWFPVGQAVSLMRKRRSVMNNRLVITSETAGLPPPFPRLTPLNSKGVGGRASSSRRTEHGSLLLGV